MSLAFACIVVWVIAAASTGTLGIWLAIGGVAAALGVAVLVLDSSVSRRILQPSPRLVLLGAAVGGLMAAATYLLYPVLARIAPFIATDTALLYSEFRAPPLVIASVALAPVILGEELVWRNVVQAALVRRLGPWGGVTLAAVAYALAHVPLGSLVVVVVALLCGIAWGTLRAVSGSLVPALVAHLVWDVLVLLWLPLDSR
jgi:membrane protease YdiL (CAAX protease family)